VLTTIAFEFLPEEITGITDAKNSSIIFVGMNAISSIITQFPEKPLLDDEPVANPFIVEPFENDISVLL